MEKSDIWRAVVTQNNNNQICVDFAIATPQNAELAHSYMIKLRQKSSKDDTFQDNLAPIFIENGEVKFSDEKYNTKVNSIKLSVLRTRILSEFNKFRTQHPDWKSTFDDMPKSDLLNTIYKDVDIYKTPTNPVEHEQIKQIAEAKFETAKRNRDNYEMGRLRMLREGD